MGNARVPTVIRTEPAINTKGRLEQRKAILDRIDERRQQERDPGIGSAVEHRIIQEELDDLVAVESSLVSNYWAQNWT